MLPAIFQGQYDALTLYQLATLCRLHYTANPTVALAAIQHGTGRRHTRTDLFTAGGSPAPRTMVLEYTDYKIVIVRGTSEAEDWFANFASVFDLVGLVPGHLVAGGWYQQAQTIYAAIFPDEDAKAKPVLFVGHSSGGSIALLLAYLRAGENTDLQTCVANFGSPKCLNAKAWESLGDIEVFRAVRHYDLVESLPPPGMSIAVGGIWGNVRTFNSFVHGGRRLYISAIDGRVANAAGVTVTVKQWAQQIIDGAFSSDMTVQQAGQLHQQLYNSVGWITPEHRVWQYCRSFRINVERAPRGPLAAYDSANAAINADDGYWTQATAEFTQGYALRQTRLPEDLVWPPVITVPVVVPPDVPAPPADVPMPSGPVQQQQRYHRRRRVMG